MRLATVQRRRASCLLLSLSLLGSTATGFGPPAIVPAVESRDAAETARATPGLVRRIREAAPPAVAARSSLLIDTGTGARLHGRHENQRLPPASTTKLVTALVVVDSLPATKRVPITVSAEQHAGGSLMGLRIGDELSVEDLLYGLLLPSGNDAAVQLALATAGDVDRFVERMNARVAALGLKNTRFRNPHGLDEPDQYSSAADLAIIAREALRRPLIARIVATEQHTVRGTFTYSLVNSNRLLATRSDADGVKTGTTDAAGQVLVGSATRGERRAITVVMNADDRFAATSDLLDHYFLDLSHWRAALPPGPFYQTAGTPWRVADRPARTVPAWHRVLTSLRLVPSGSGGGEVQFFLGNDPIAESRVAP